MRFSTSRRPEYSVHFFGCVWPIAAYGGQAKRRRPPLQTVARFPYIQLVAGQLQTVLTSFAPHYYFGILQTRKQDQKR